MNDRHTFLCDVTLRDGGSLNHWNFTVDEILNFSKIINCIAVDYLELGYWGYTKTNVKLLNGDIELLSNVKALCDTTKIAVMYYPQGEELEPLLKERHAYVDLIRIPYKKEIPISSLGKIAELCHKYGVPVSLNIVSITSYTLDEVVHFINVIQNTAMFDILYLADSRGSLTLDIAKSLFGTVRNSWKYALGFHGHDNIKLAMANSALAIEEGFNYVDGSINGFGLGGGNTNLKTLHERYRNTRMELFDTAESILSLKFDEDFKEYFYLSGKKNIEQEWVYKIYNTFGKKTKQFLESLESKKYERISQVFDQ